jgi:hypothetical protein
VRQRARAAYRRLEALHREYFVSKWRSGLQREASRQEDAFLAWVFLEALGVESPASWYTLELYPEVLESFHQWHQRMGLRRFPEPGVCC